MLRCNACWSDLEGKSVVTSCQHLFCKCATCNCPWSTLWVIEATQGRNTSRSRLKELIVLRLRPEMCTASGGERRKLPGLRRHH